MDMGPIEDCSCARAAIESARAGIEHIRQTEPRRHLALFMTVGLLTTVRGITHALINGDVQWTEAHRRVIDEWKKEKNPKLARFTQLILVARNQLIKEWTELPLVASAHGANFHDYSIAIYIPRTEERDAVLTPEEIEERESAGKVAKLVGEDALVDGDIRIDVLYECEAALAVLEAEVNRIEQKIVDLLIPNEPTESEVV